MTRFRRFAEKAFFVLFIMSSLYLIGHIGLWLYKILTGGG